MKILFVTSEMFNKSGAGMHARSYCNMLQEVVGEENFFKFAFPKRNISDERDFMGYVTKRHYSIIEMLFNLLFRGDPLIGKDVLEDLIWYISENNIDIVFLFRSTQRYLFKKVKSCFSDTPVIVFFHDIFPDVIKSRMRTGIFSFLIKLPLFIEYMISEKYCVRYSSANIVLNNRDRQSFVKYYRREPSLVLPIVCNDCFDYRKIDTTSDKQLVLLFVGQYFEPNVRGLHWFVRNVMPRLSSSVVLQVVGRGMERLRTNSDFQKASIIIIGTVDSVDDYYYKADLVVEPIFEGTGMKCKTAEAMMYGKEILATREALVGYDCIIDSLCENSDQFVDRINDYQNRRPFKFNKRIRDLYLEYYSVKSATNKICHLLNNCITQTNK